jgi:hypothetical protein
MLVCRIIAEVVDHNFRKALILSTFEDRTAQRRFEHFRQNGYDIYSHNTSVKIVDEINNAAKLLIFRQMRKRTHSKHGLQIRIARILFPFLSMFGKISDLLA